MAITMTERAAKEIKRIFVEQKMPEDTALRVSIKGGGCSGFTYNLGVARESAKDDEVFVSHDLRIVCDRKSYLYLSGTEVDFNDDLMNRGFVFNNPHAKGQCGCGMSFSA